MHFASITRIGWRWNLRFSVSGRDNVAQFGQSREKLSGPSLRLCMLFFAFFTSYETCLAIFFSSFSSSFSFLSSSILLHSFFLVSGMNGLRNGIELGVWVVFILFPAYMALFSLPLVSFFNLFGME